MTLLIKYCIKNVGGGGGGWLTTTLHILDVQFWIDLRKWVLFFIPINTMKYGYLNSMRKSVDISTYIAHFLKFHK